MTAMKKTSFLACGVLALTLSAVLSWDAAAQDNSSAKDRPYISALRSLSINRSLLMRSEAEYRTLLKEERRGASGNMPERLSNLRYKIQAFKEDAERLQTQLPGDVLADDFLEEMVDHQKKPGRSQNTVDLEAEKKIEEKIRSIYRMHEKALSYVAQDQYDEAEKMYEEIVLLSPDDDEAYLLLGHTCLAIGHYEKAGEAFGNAIHINPANAREIPRLYENILLENPSDDNVMAQLGFSHLLLGNAGQAREFFEEALKVDPSNETARRGLVELRPYAS